MVSKFEGIDRAEFNRLASQIRTAKTLQGIDSTINDILLKVYAEDITATTGENPGPAKTFKQWQEAGRQVRKGAKAFKIYSRPKSELKAEKGEQPGDKDNQIFFIANVFFKIQTDERSDS